jgi:hydrogenase nickel incorporation protein HypA/HybF
MHELAIAETLVEKVDHQRREGGFRHVEAVGLRIGALTDVATEALEFGFERMTEGTALAGARLEIERVPARGHCDDCDIDFDIHDLDFVCPVCGSREITLIGGDELEVTYIRVEETDPIAAGA